MNKNKTQYSYAELHNKAVRMYRKTALFLLWAGVASVLATLIGIFEVDSGFAMSFSANIYLNHLLLGSDLPSYAKYIIIFAAAILTGALFAALGYFAQLGKKAFLFAALALYLADFAAIFFVYDAIWTTPYAFTLATHLVVLGAVMVAVFSYYNVISIERRFHGDAVLNLDDAEDGKETR